MDCKWTTAVALLGAGAAGLVGGLYLGYRAGRKGLSAKARMEGPLKNYLLQHNVEDPILHQHSEMSSDHRVGHMTTGVQVRKLLTFLCRSIGAKKVLDIGVFTGCSSHAMALALPEDGKVMACDISREYADLGRPYWKRGGVLDKIDLRIQPANRTLQELIDAGEGGTFDMIFIDADKQSYPIYFKLGLELLRVGGIFVVDNALWRCRVTDPSDQGNEPTAIREMNKLMRDNAGVDYILLDICDGVALAQKL